MKRGIALTFKDRLPRGLLEGLGYWSLGYKDGVKTWVFITHENEIEEIERRIKDE